MKFILEDSYENKKVNFTFISYYTYFLLTLFTGCNNKKEETENLTKVKLNEVVRSVFMLLCM